MNHIEELIEEFKLNKPSRIREDVYKRFYLMHILHGTTDLTLSEIGKLFGRNHTSVIYALKQHERWTFTKDQEYIRAIHPLPELVGDEGRLPKTRYFNCTVTENSVTIRGRFTKKTLEELNRPLNKMEISAIFDTI